MNGLTTPNTMELLGFFGHRPDLFSDRHDDISHGSNGEQYADDDAYVSILDTGQRPYRFLLGLWRGGNNIWLT